MSSATVYATDLGVSHLKSASNTLNDVLIATSADATNASTSEFVGLYKDVKYFSKQHLLSFDLSSIPGGSTITAAVFTTKTSATHSSSVAGSQLELAPYDWGSTIEIADYLTKVEYSALAAVATYAIDSNIATDTVMTYTSGAPLIANLLVGGVSKFMLCNKAFRDGTTPTSTDSHSAKIYTCTYATSSYRPTLTITYTAGGGGGGGGTTYNATFFGSNF